MKPEVALPYPIYAFNHSYGTYRIPGFKYKSNTQFYHCQMALTGSRIHQTNLDLYYDQYYNIIYEVPTDRFYYVYINLNQDLVTQLNLLGRFYPYEIGPPDPLVMPDQIHQDIRNGRAHLLLDYSIEGVGAYRLNTEYFQTFLGEYKNYAMLITSDYNRTTSSFVPTIFRNYWERSVMRHSDSHYSNKMIDHHVRPQIENKRERKFKGLMKNRIMKSHRLGLSYIFENDMFFSENIDFSFSSKATYNENESQEVWLDRCKGDSVFAAEIFEGLTQQNLYDYAVATKTKNLSLESNVDLNVNQASLYGETLYRVHADAYFQIVTETYYHGPTRFFSEKTFQPIMMLQPFVLVAESGAIDALRELEYDVFDDIIDHSYDLENDPTMRMRVLIAEICRLCQISHKQWSEILHDIYPRLENNRWNLHKAFTKFNEFDILYTPEKPIEKSYCGRVFP